MSAEDKKYLTYGTIGVLVIVILWLLNKAAPLNLVENDQPQQVPGNTLNVGGDVFNGSTFGPISQETPQQLAINLIYPQSAPPASSDCSCGCDSNTPANIALQTVATTVNQFQAGLLAVTSQTIQALQASIPDWLGQYIGSGGAIAPGNGTI
jgi:hypothetical protein